ncbi:MAG TPA: hypothetical protein VFK50_04055 [Sphingomicrobium sp.]|nr:hypothetical protein [Sphingomicrobium sp.]
MNQMGLVADAERLPWLTDDRPRRSWRGAALLIGGTIAALLVAGVSYWLGLQTGQPAEPSTTIALPEPVVGMPEEIDTEQSVEDAKPQPMVAPEAEPQRAAPIVDRPAPVRAKRKVAPVKKVASARRMAPKKAVLRPWPVRQVDGATGRMVRIGTFASARQAKKGWWKVVGTYPGMKKIPALVVPVQSLRNGQTYYRLQMGTTSQAHSEVLCQRMRIIGQSCVVIGLPPATTAA